MVRRAHALILSFTRIANEPRVVRQARSLVETGWRVTLAGHPCDDPTPDGCGFVPLAVPGRTPTVLAPASLAALLGSRFWDGSAQLHYWLRREHRTAAARLAGTQADIVVAHDYATAPLGRRLARKWGARLIVDCHEYALGEYPDNARWKLLYAPYVDAIQRTHLRRASAVTTVSDGIAQRLAADYDLVPRPSVVRNVPRYEPSRWRPTGETIEVLYHGIVTPSRELDTLVEAFAHTRAEFHLVIRGIGDTGYVDRLRQVAERLGLAERVRFDPPVPLSELVQAANRSDVGIFLHRDSSPQMRFVLPNKLFEYIMAGLAVCVSDLPEMAPIVKAHKLGSLISEVRPEVVAQAINALDRSAIDAFKRNAIAAAHELCWEKEQTEFLRLCGPGPS